MPDKARTRTVTVQQAREYLAKAEEYLLAAVAELEAGRNIAATSLAIHAGINAADAVCGARLQVRSAGQDHNQVIKLLRQTGTDGTALAKELSRLVPMKTKAEYEPDDIPPSVASKAVERAQGCVAIAGRVIRSLA
jgi:hypothetical protein